MDRRCFRPASIMMGSAGGRGGAGGGGKGGEGEVGEGGCGGKGVIGDQRAETLSWASGKAPKAVPMDLFVVLDLIQTHNRLKRMLFIRTKQSMRIFGVSPFSELQNDI